jgi:hypothetical protein
MHCPDLWMRSSRFTDELPDGCTVRNQITRSLFPLEIALAILCVSGCVSLPEPQQDFQSFPDRLTCMVEDSHRDDFHGSNGIKQIIVGFSVGERVSDVVARNKQVLGIGKEPKAIWIARSKKTDASEEEFLPVDWLPSNEIGNPETDYALEAGDRMCVSKRTDFHLSGILCRATVWDRLCLWIESFSEK